MSMKILIGEIITLILVMASFSGCSQVSSHESIVPVATDVTRPVTIIPSVPDPAPEKPAEMDLAQFTVEFQSNPSASLEKYTGRRFVFRSVYAEDISTIYKPFNWDQFVMNGKIKFRPEYPASLTDLKVQSVMDIEGIVEGFQGPFLIITDCRYTVTDTSNAMDRPDFQNVYA